ncbi:MAG: tRNA (N6-isopentenyl adenosine(37)-C2)-methylthiotransferase MiaB [Clostridia bacterium]|nr:tRNA (N6-isopentenyl adenosine(37)-C2)-methylthiotransferase MiaB [Clostridia bacterium]
MAKRYFISTFGCQANERDSETLAGLLEKKGYIRTNDIQQADIILFNTCCIREKAENKVLSKVGELKELKEQNPDLIIGICGCMVQQEKMAEKIRHRASHVDLIFGTHNLEQLPELIDKLQETKKSQVQILADREEIREGLPAVRQVPFKALVNITYGCNNFCTYCIVPYVRGREKSRQPQNILAEIKELANEGVIEVMLLGQNVNSYGQTLEPPFTFAQLLQEVNNIDKLKRIRYMTSHPRDFNPELIKTISQLDKVCPHFHLPLQSGSNKILQKMNRGYTREHYQELVEEIRRLVPQASITTDLIVGFPGETEEDFRDTLNLVEELRFDSAFTFIYSPRSGTAAAKMLAQIPLTVKKRRLQKLMQLQNKISLEINQNLKGQVMEVLVEGLSQKDAAILEGRTKTNKTVLFTGAEELIGKFVEVEITIPQTWVLKGEIIEKR